ncbi:MAG: DinB family protein [Acidobacteria bacterium]|nr:DinB family protein [Acidobacteriota bacterium]
MKSGRPERGEYADYAQSDIDYVLGDDAVAVLRAQGEHVVALLSSLGNVDGLTYAPGKWTLKEVVGHLIDDERIFAYRALCVARREPRPLPGFEENDYVAATHFEQRTMDSLLDEYRSVRAASLAFFTALTEEEWLRRGMVNGYEASVRGLAFHVAGHELHHLRTVNERYLG